MLLPAGFHPSVGQPVSIGTFGGLSSPAPAEKAEGLEAEATVFGRSHTRALLGWRDTKAYTRIYSTPTARVPKDKVR